MKTAVVYNYPLQARKEIGAHQEFEPHAKLWVETLLKFDPGEPYQVIVCLVDGEPTEADKAIFKALKPKFLTFSNPGLDVGAYLSVCDLAADAADFMVFCNTRVHFWKAGWLSKFVAARERFGPQGLYGASASYQVPSRPWSHPPRWPNPHIRTACMATDPKIFRRYPYRLASRNDAFRAESGKWNVGQWFEDHGWPVRMVAWDGVYDKFEWRKPKNIFRRGDQSNCLVRDRHLDIYSNCANQKEKRELEVLAGGAEVVLK